MGGVVVPVAAVAAAVVAGDTRLRERDRHCSLVARRGWGSSRMLEALHPVLQPGLSASQGEYHPEVDHTEEVGKLVGRRLYWDIRNGQESDKRGDVPPVCLAKLSSIIRSKMERARTKVSFIDTRSAVYHLVIYRA